MDTLAGFSFGALVFGALVFGALVFLSALSAFLADFLVDFSLGVLVFCFFSDFLVFLAFGFLSFFAFAVRENLCP